MTSMFNDPTPRRWRPKDNWVSPFHARDARAMERDYPRDEYGRPIRDARGRQLLIDKRPVIMRPERKVYRIP